MADTLEIVADVDTFPRLLEQIYAQNFTGELTLTMHCLNGIPRRVDIPTKVVRVDFAAPLATSGRRKRNST